MEKSFISRKEKIILESVEIINELGTGGLTISEIARRQNVTEGAIYKHFKSKEEIMKSVAEKFGLIVERVVNSALESEMTALQKIVFISGSITGYYENYPSISSLIFTRKDFPAGSEANEILSNMDSKLFSAACGFLAKGVDKGETVKSFSPENLTYILIGSFKEIIFAWRKSGYSYSLKEKTAEVLEDICGLIFKKQD